MTPDKLKVARAMYDSREHTVAAIAKVIGVSRASVYRHLATFTGTAPASASDAPDGESGPPR